jgi:hypothetical protein
MFYPPNVSDRYGISPPKMLTPAARRRIFSSVVSPVPVQPRPLQQQTAHVAPPRPLQPNIAPPRPLQLHVAPPRPLQLPTAQPCTPLLMADNAHGEGCSFWVDGREPVDQDYDSDID